QERVVYVENEFAVHEPATRGQRTRDVQQPHPEPVHVTAGLAGAEVRKLPAQRTVRRDVLEHHLTDQVVTEHETGQGREDGVVGGDGLVDRQGVALADRIAGVSVRDTGGVTVYGNVARRRSDGGPPRTRGPP